MYGRYAVVIFNGLKELKMKKYTEEELKQIFKNRSNCYADSDEVIMAMDEDRFIEVLKELKILPTLKIMIYDYYYSEQHEAHMKATYAMMGEQYLDTFINGRKYTEMVKEGEYPMTAHFSDIKKIHTGTDETVVVR